MSAETTPDLTEPFKVLLPVFGPKLARDALDSLLQAGYVVVKAFATEGLHIIPEGHAVVDGEVWRVEPHEFDFLSNLMPASLIPTEEP